MIFRHQIGDYLIIDIYSDHLWEKYIRVVFMLCHEGALTGARIALMILYVKLNKDYGKYFRYQSPFTTIKQLSALKEKYGASWFKFADDSMGYFDIEYLEELAQGLEPLNIKFGCSIRPGSINAEKVKLLKKMGIVAASVGVESGNQDIRKNILNRHMSDEQIIDSIRLLMDYDIRISTFNLIGLPTETRYNVFETIRLNKKAGVKATNVYIIYPYPGTEINKKYKINII